MARTEPDRFSRESSAGNLPEYPPEMTSAPERPRILIVEDDELVRDGVSSSLRALGYRVTAASDGTELDALLSVERPDLALLDVTLPVGPDGFELARRLRSASSVPIVFMTARDELDDRMRGFDVGADDYIVKPFATQELAARVRAVLRRAGGGPNAALFSVRDVVLDAASRTVERAGVPLSLTPTEFDILWSLMRSPGQPRAKRELLEEVWGYGDQSPHLVEVQISALRRKLETLGPRVVVTCRDGAYMVAP